MKRKVQEVYQSQTAAHPGHQEEEKTHTQTSTNRRNIRKALRLVYLSPKRGNRNAKRTEKHKSKKHKVRHKIYRLLE